MGNLFGREKIYTTVSAITKENVLVVLNEALPIHFRNMADEEYLYWFRRGRQDVLNKEKEVRPEINHKITQNIAGEVVAFKNGYFLTQPVTYIARKGKESISEGVNILNDYLYLSGKHEADNNLVDWFHTVGIATLFIQSSKDNDVPVKTFALDPRNSFVVYSTRPGNEAMMGVNIVKIGEKDGQVNVIFDVFTKDHIYRVSGGCSSQMVESDRGRVTMITGTGKTIDKIERNALGEVPIIEYTYDRNRMSSFESVIPLLNSINYCQSNRMDSIEQFVNSLLVFYNCELGEDDDGNPISPAYIRAAGALFLKNIGQDKADVKELTAILDQSQIQVFIDDLRHQVCDIAGMPFTSDSQGGTSDNNGAVYLRSGWATADTFARNTEDLFKEANKRFTRIFLKVLRTKGIVSLNEYDIDVQFVRNELDNLLVKTQGALNLKQLGLSPEICLARSGLSNDPTGDIEKSKEYIKIAFSTEEKVEASNVVMEGEEANDEAGQRSN